MNKHFQQVKAFHAACDVAMPDKPTLLNGAGHNWITYIAEDLNKECLGMKSDAKRLNGENEVLNRTSYMLEELVEFMQAKTIEDQSDALTDLIYFAIGTFTLMGVQPEAIFDIVQNANMSKVGADGKVIRDAQGKIRKPKGWVSPEPLIVKEIERQAQGDYEYPRIWRD